MENDPNKKDSKGKRIFKKALRRNSKTSNSGQGSGLEPSVGVSRSNSLEPEPEPDGAALRPTSPDGLSDALKSKKVEIRESQNKTIAEAPVADNNNVNANESFPDPKEPGLSIRNSAKRNLKRKLEEESGVASTSGASSGAGNSESDADDKDPSKDKKKKNRCAVCRKKVGLTGFECRCGGLFCAVHRYSDKHECSFDYRELGAQEIRRNNPVVVSQKIHKI